MVIIKNNDKVTAIDKETDERYYGIFSSENLISFTLTKVKGHKGILVFSKEHYFIGG